MYTTANAQYPLRIINLRVINIISLQKYVNEQVRAGT